MDLMCLGGKCTDCVESSQDRYKVAHIMDTSVAKISPTKRQGQSQFYFRAFNLPRVFRVLAPLSAMIRTVGIVWPGRIISEVDNLQ
jgi:hypothetical protein